MSLSEIMKEKKVTSKKLAELTGISQRTIEGYRAERREPTVRNGLIIAAALEVDPYELYDISERKEE